LYFDEVSIWLTIGNVMTNSHKGSDNAQAVALQALSYLVSDNDRLDRFLLTTGLQLDQVRELAADIHFQAGILDYLLSDDALLQDFSAEIAMQPTSIAAIRRQLPGATDAA
jgi:Protein of unknown function (DUF3572)